MKVGKIGYSKTSKATIENKTPTKMCVCLTFYRAHVSSRVACSDLRVLMSITICLIHEITLLVISWMHAYCL